MLKDSTFNEHAKWLAFERNSLTWPKAWRAVIYKINKYHNIQDDGIYYRVLPRNPAYEEYLDETEKAMLTGAKSFSFRNPPLPYLPAIDFETMEEVVQWAEVCNRIK